MDPDIDFGALFKQFDTLLMGRRTYEGIEGQGGGGRCLLGHEGRRRLAHPEAGRPSRGQGAVERVAEAVAALREEKGKDIWLFGGGGLFRSLLELGLVDTVEVALVPVLLGGGIPLLPSPATQARLSLTRHRLYEKTGTVLLEYSVERRPARAAA